MIFMHKTLQKQGLSNYQIQKLVKDGKLFFIKPGIYATEENINYFEYIAKKFPNAIITLATACCCYGLIKEKEEPYTITTKQKDRKIHDEKIKQIFMKDDLYDIGMCNIKYKGIDIKIYDLERLLIEVVRSKTNMEFDTYKNIITSYKKLTGILNKRKLEMYMPNFKDPRILKRINNEVFGIN